jgi:hypothetical protein
MDIDETLKLHREFLDHVGGSHSGAGSHIAATASG